MADTQVRSYGVSRQRHIAEEVDAHAENIQVLGFTVIQAAVASDDLTDIRARLDGLLESDSAHAGDHDLDRNIVRCPLSRDSAFLRLATLESVIAVCRRVLGEKIVLLQQNAIFNPPLEPQYQSRWHRDLPYQHFVASEPLALNALICIDEFTTGTGGTFVLPGSHRFEELPSSPFIGREERVIEAPAGSIIMMDAMLYHRAGYNRSTHVRRGLNHLIGRPLLAQQIDIPRLLNGEHEDHPFMGPFLGYQWNPAANVSSWRAKRT